MYPIFQVLETKMEKKKKSNSASAYRRTRPSVEL